MFKYCNLTNTSSHYYNNKTGLLQKDCTIDVHDDDFTQQTKISTIDFQPYEVLHVFVLACIKVYEEKKLDVAQNLTLFVLREAEIQILPVKQIVKICDTLPQFRKYKSEIEKTLLFS